MLTDVFRGIILKFVLTYGAVSRVFLTSGKPRDGKLG